MSETMFAFAKCIQQCLKKKLHRYIEDLGNIYIHKLAQYFPTLVFLKKLFDGLITKEIRLFVSLCKKTEIIDEILENQSSRLETEIATENTIRHLRTVTCHRFDRQFPKRFQMLSGNQRHAKSVNMEDYNDKCYQKKLYRSPLTVVLLTKQLVFEASVILYPSNTINLIANFLPEELNLKLGHWEVEISEITHHQCTKIYEESSFFQHKAFSLASTLLCGAWYPLFHYWRPGSGQHAYSRDTPWPRKLYHSQKVGENA